MNVIPNYLNKCDCDTEDDVDIEQDGITVKYTCALCGALLGDIIVGAEP
jgi:hypothetical protein